SGFLTAMLLAPFLWLVFEWLLNVMQFPWCLTGYSQYDHLRIAQFATLFGVYGLTWLIVAINAAIATSVILRKHHYSIVMLALFIVIVLYGNYRISRPVAGDDVVLGCIQGNVPQDEKIDYRFADEVNKKHLRMTRELLAHPCYGRQTQTNCGKPDIIFWSESSTLYTLENGGEWAEQVYDLVRQMHLP